MALDQTESASLSQVYMDILHLSFLFLFSLAY